MNLRLLESHYTSLQNSLPEDEDHIHLKAFGLLYTRGLFVMMCVMLKGCQKENMELLWNRLPRTYPFSDLNELLQSVFNSGNIDLESLPPSIKKRLILMILSGQSLKPSSWRKLTLQALLEVITFSKDQEEVRLARLAQKWLLHAIQTNPETLARDIYVLNETREDMPESYPSTLITRYNAILNSDEPHSPNKQ